jgi:hypothetical protein
MHIEACNGRLLAEWAALRHALGPEDTLKNLKQEAEAMLARSDAAVFIAREGNAVTGLSKRPCALTSTAARDRRCLLLKGYMSCPNGAGVAWRVL